MSNTVSPFRLVPSQTSVGNLVPVQLDLVPVELDLVPDLGFSSWVGFQKLFVPGLVPGLIFNPWVSSWWKNQIKIN